MNLPIDHGTLSELDGLNQELLVLGQRINEPGFIWTTDQNEYQVKKSRRDYIARLIKWYQAKGGEILALVGERDIAVAVGSKRFEGRDESESISARELALSFLASQVRNQGIDYVLTGWVRLLTVRGLISKDQAAGLDLAVPVETERIERDRLAREQEQAFLEGRERLKRAALAYASETGNPWGLTDYLECWRSKQNRQRDEKGLLQFASDLGARRLLPLGDRIQNSVDDLWAKIKSLGVMA